MKLTQDFIANIQKAFPNTVLFRMLQYDDGVVVNGKPMKKSGAMPVSFDSWQKWNNDKNRYSIFFTPNGQFGIDGGTKRSKDLAKYINCLFVERDDDKEFMVEFWKSEEKQPSIIIKSKRGYHCYWLLEEPLSYKKYGDQWMEINKKRSEIFGGDPSVIEVSRMMRLAGSQYRKNDDGGDLGGDLVECVKFDLNLRYKLEDFAPIVQGEEKEKRFNTYTKEHAQGANSSKDTWEQIRRLDVRDVLHDLFPQFEVKGGDIYEGGKATSGYKYHQSGNYLNDFNQEKDHRPEGGPWDVAKKALGENGRVYMYFYDKFGIGEKKTTEIKQTIKEGNDDPTIEISSSDAVIKIDPETCKIYKTNSKGESEIGIGYINPTGFYKLPDGGNVYVVRYKKISGEEGTINMKDIASINDFMKALSRYGITFTGTKMDFMAILQYIHETKVEYEYINTLGMINKDLVISKAGKYILDNKYYIDCAGLESSNRKTHEILKIGESMSHEKFREILTSLSTVYEEHIIYSMFCIYGIAMFSRYIRETLSMLPLMILVGLTQSGKTTQKRLMMKMFGVDKAVETQASATEFSIMHMMNNYLPVHMSEFDNNVLKFDFDSFAKNNYDNTSSTRGRADQTLVKYPFNALLVVDGESRTLAPSVYSRSIMMFMNPSYMRKEMKRPPIVNKYFIDNYDKIEGLVGNMKNRIEKLNDMTKDIMSSEKSRIIENYALMLAFSDCFGFTDIVEEHILKQLFVQFDMKGEDNLNVYIKNIMNLATINLMPVAFKSKNMIIDFFIDYLKYDKKRIADMQSNIQTVNHHFGGGGLGTEQLCIPLEHIFKTPTLHPIFNRYVSRMEAHMQIDFGYEKSAIKAYVDSNNYKEVAFYERLILPY